MNTNTNTESAAADVAEALASGVAVEGLSQILLDAANVAAIRYRAEIIRLTNAQRGRCDLTATDWEEIARSEAAGYRGDLSGLARHLLADALADRDGRRHPRSWHADYLADDDSFTEYQLAIRAVVAEIIRDEDDAAAAE